MDRVFVANNPLEAHFVKSLLERDGINARVTGEALFGLRPEIGISSDTLPAVWILNSGHLQRAQQLVAEYERGKTKTRR